MRLSRISYEYIGGVENEHLFDEDANLLQCLSFKGGYYDVDMLINSIEYNGRFNPRDYIPSISNVKVEFQGDKQPIITDSNLFAKLDTDKLNDHLLATYMISEHESHNQFTTMSDKLQNIISHEIHPMKSLLANRLKFDPYIQHICILKESRYNYMSILILMMLFPNDQFIFGGLSNTNNIEINTNINSIRYFFI